MADQFDEDFEELKSQVSGVFDVVDKNTPMFDIDIAQSVYYVWILWMDFHLFINSPYVPPQYPPKVITPLKDSNGKEEHVFTIFDYGDHFSTSVGSHLADGSRSTGRMLNTILKIMDLIVKRVQSVDVNAGSDEAGDEAAIRVAFDGHEIAQRMAFKQCVMHHMNILVTNFDPGEWGESQLRTMEHLAEKGYLPGVKAAK